MMEDEDMYKIVSSLLESDSESDERDATKRVCELERQIALLRVSNRKLRELVLDIKSNPSWYENKDISEIFEEIESNTAAKSPPQSVQSIKELALPFSTDMFSFPPINFWSVDPDIDGPSPRRLEASSIPSTPAEMKFMLPPSTSDISALPPDPKKQPAQQKRRRKSLESNFLSDDISLDDYRGCIIGLSKYQPGCRFIQKKLDTAKDKDEEARLVKMVLDEVFPSLVEVLTDTYGQYLIPNVVAHCNTKQRVSIIEAIKPNIFELSCSK